MSPNQEPDQDQPEVTTAQGDGAETDKGGADTAGAGEAGPDEAGAGDAGADRAAQQKAPNSETPGHLIVAIGASAGGMDAFEKLFSGDNGSLDSALVIVQHIDPSHETRLPELLQTLTFCPVTFAQDGVEPLPGHVYVAPPNRLVGLLHGRFRLIEPGSRKDLGRAIDFFLSALAQDQGPRAVGVILSGTGGDGAEGLRAIRAHCGVTMVQDPSTATYDGMPKTALATEAVDFELAPEQILIKLKTVSKRQQSVAIPTEQVTPTDEEFISRILILLRSRTGHDLSSYKKNMIKRRVMRRMHMSDITRQEDYIRFLQQSTLELDTLFGEMLIGVTGFFRDSESFEALDRLVMTPLFAEQPPREEVRIWSVGCSTGEEAYSLAMLCAKHLDGQFNKRRIQIFATDIDNRAIEFARQGSYQANAVTDIPAQNLALYFERQNGTYRAKKIIRDMIIFSEQSVIKDPPFSRLDLVVCRNVLIYMEAGLQGKIISLFHYALRAGGYLFLGPSETIGDHDDLFQTLDRSHKILRKHSGTVPVGSWIDFSVLRRSNMGAAAEGSAVTMRERTPVRDRVEQMLLSDYCPPAVLVDGNGNIQHIHGRTGRFLEPAQGKPSYNLLSMARPGLHSQLAAGLRRAATAKRELAVDGVRVANNGGWQVVDFRILPLADSAGEPENYLVTFVAHETGPEQPLPEVESVPASTVPPSDDTARIQELERDLSSTREYLQTTIEELETSNEELKSTNEELQSTNEELQSTNEEHETSKEELQSVNEELVTLNSELQSKVDQLSKINNDMANLLASTQIGTIFLDSRMAIRRFTPAVNEIGHLIDADIGRPLRHIRLDLNYDTLLEDIEQVVQTLVPIEREARTPNDKWFAVRISPYRTSENLIDGAVITFIDVTDRKGLEVDRRLQAVIRDSSDAIMVTGFDGRILAWNRGAERVYGFNEVAALQQSIDIIVPEERRQETHELLRRVRAGQIVEPIVTERRSQEGQRIDVQLTATLIRDKQESPLAIAVTERDITRLKALSQRAARADAITELAEETVIVATVAGRVEEANAAALAVLKTKDDSVEGKFLADFLLPATRPVLQQAMLHCLEVGRAGPVDVAIDQTSQGSGPVSVRLRLKLIKNKGDRLDCIVLVGRILG